ncbi:SIR2 family protein [Microbacterium mangrovi]|uniref:SIR2 family protein n=1 Tax=Microbacterium mangrovi TaxID=1348253 RepID=UPI0009DD6F56|nr:SIR2 family protein [Microbacterium mangrovi]
MVTHTPFFLRDAATLDAIDAISAADDIVVYCGAGVSIDRTGLSWPMMIDGVFNEAKNRDRRNRERDHKTLELILNGIKDQPQRASIISQFFTEGRHLSARDFLTPKLQQVLYEDNGWSEGLLLRHLVRLAINGVLRVHSLTILTTNYDTYIEEEFDGVYERLVRTIAEVGGSQSVPGLEVCVADNDPLSTAWHSRITHEPHRTDAKVRLVYLHGRVPRAGGASEGTIVFDERSYSDTRAAVADHITETIRGRALLVLGASLTDGPLIEALGRTAQGAEGRFALVRPDLPQLDPSPVTEYTSHGAKHHVTEEDAKRILAYRGQHLGVKVLHPLGHSQTAQFVHELGIAIRLHRSTKKQYRAAKTDFSYERRLQRWANDWGSNHRAPGDAHQYLADALKNQIVTRIPEKDGENASLRLEVWVRMRPGTANRTLTLFANSTGPFLIEDHLLRREEISSTSTNASVCTLLMGKPQVNTLSDLRGEVPRPTRWTTFLSIPIYLHVRREISKRTFSGIVPTGVVTLCGQGESRLAERIEEDMTLEQIDDLKAAMIDAGRDLLRPLNWL